MEIWTEFRFHDFFAWQFSERELKLPERKLFLDKIKSELKYKTEWMYFREEKKWLIHKSRFIDFMEIVIEFYQKLVFKQGEMF